MRAVRVLRFSGPMEGRDALLTLARRAGIDAEEIPGRTRPDECWIEFAIPAAASTDVEPVARSWERAVTRLGTGYRLREYLTEVRRASTGELDHEASDG